MIFFDTVQHLNNNNAATNQNTSGRLNMIVYDNFRGSYCCAQYVLANEKEESSSRFHFVVALKHALDFAYNALSCGSSDTGSENKKKKSKAIVRGVEIWLANINSDVTAQLLSDLSKLMSDQSQSPDGQTLSFLKIKSVLNMDTFCRDLFLQQTIDSAEAAPADEDHLYRLLGLAIKRKNQSLLRFINSRDFCNLDKNKSGLENFHSHVLLFVLLRTEFSFS